MNYRYIQSYYCPEQKEVVAVAEEVAPVEVAAPAVVEEDDTLTAIEPEPVVYGEPVFSSYFDDEQVPLAYRMKYTISAPAVAVQPVAQPVVQAVAQPVEAPKAVVEQLPQDYFRRPAEASTAPVAPVEQAVAPVAPVKTTYAVYKNLDEASNYAWAGQSEEVHPTYTHTPYQSGSRGLEESTYVGFKNDVYAAYGKPSVPACYNVTPTAPVAVQAPVQAVASLECLTAEEGPAYGAAAPVAPAAPRSRFVSQVKAAPLPQPSQKPVVDYSSVGGNAFCPVVMPQSEYQYGHLNDLVSCINI